MERHFNGAHFLGRGAVDAIEQHFGGPPANLLLELGHRGQGRVHQLGGGDVVEAGDSDVFGDAQPGFADGEHGAHGHQIIRGKHGPRARREAEQLLHPLVAAGLGVIAAADEHFLERDVMLGERLAVTLDAPRPRRCIFDAGDHPDAGVAALDQVVDDGPGRGDVVDEDHIHRRGSRGLEKVHHGDVELRQVI